jgi:hypothetical protein
LVFINSCTFNNNNATDGGAAYVYNGAQVSNSIFTENSATYGGAVYLNIGGMAFANSCKKSAFNL